LILSRCATVAATRTALTISPAIRTRIITRIRIRIIAVLDTSI